jgi:hypothetical protein
MNLILVKPFLYPDHGEMMRAKTAKERSAMMKARCK